MSKAIRVKAGEFLGFGMPKQAVFDMLVLEHPDAKPKKIAEIVRYMPTLDARERYRKLHVLLLVAVVSYGVLRALRPIITGEVDWSLSYRLVTLAPIATVLLGWSLWRWQGQVFEWVGWINLWSGFGLVSGLGALAKGEGDAWSIGFSALAVGIGVLTIYLAKRVFPKYKEEEDAPGVAPPRYVFPQEGGTWAM